MARLYRYADSSQDGETQYYILDKGRQKPITIQVYGVANRLFDHLKYEPGVRGNKSKEGDKLPRSLMYALYNRGLIGTDGGEELTKNEIEDIIDYDGTEPVSISEGDIQVLKDLLVKYGGSKADELSKLLELIKVEKLDLTEEISERLKELGVSVNDVEDHLSRESEKNTWLKSLEWIEEDLIIEGCAVGSEGDPVYKFSTEGVAWDLYDLRWRDEDDADFLIVINPMSGKSPKQSIRIKQDKLFGWSSYKDRLDERQVREMSKILLDVVHVLESTAYSFEPSNWEVPQPNRESLVLNPKTIVESYFGANIQSKNDISSPKDVEGMIVAKDDSRFRVRFPNCDVVCFPIPEDAEKENILVGEYFDTDLIF